MSMITRLATKLLAAFSVVALMASPMQALDASDMSFAFGAKAAAPASQQIELASARGMTATEMQETEGAVVWIPIVIAGTRLVVTQIGKHAIEQQIKRGVSTESIRDTLLNPGPGSRSFISGPNVNTTQFRGQTSTVSVNREGRITTVWKTSRNKRW